MSENDEVLEELKGVPGQLEEVPECSRLASELRQEIVFFLGRFERLLDRIDELDSKARRWAMLAKQDIEALKDRKRPTQREIARHLVYEHGKEGLTARQVAEGLLTLGYGQQIGWRNFYSSVTTALLDMAKRGELEKEVVTGERRAYSIFTRPFVRKPAAALGDGFLPQEAGDSVFRADSA